MTWNNRIYRHVFEHNGEKQVTYAIHETHYDKYGKVKLCTVEPMCGHFESVDEMIKSLEKMLEDAKRYKGDVLEYK